MDIWVPCTAISYIFEVALHWVIIKAPLNWFNQFCINILIQLIPSVKFSIDNEAAFSCGMFQKLINTLAPIFILSLDIWLDGIQQKTSNVHNNLAARNQWPGILHVLLFLFILLGWVGELNWKLLLLKQKLTEILGEVGGNNNGLFSS